MVMQSKDTSKPDTISNIEEKSSSIQRHACKAVEQPVSLPWRATGINGPGVHDIHPRLAPLTTS
jgi:hypothetical protein